MFLPGGNGQSEKQELQKSLKRVEGWAERLIPEAIRADCTVGVQEVQCGDPMCAPIDTAITFLFNSGGQGIMGIPMEAREITLAELQRHFPPGEILKKWHRGEEAAWPPDDDDDVRPELETIQLRFPEGTAVLCRTGPTDWSPGVIIQQWYRENGWPPGSFAPYKILLDDGRKIYAPADVDQVIKLNPNKRR